MERKMKTRTKTLAAVVTVSALAVTLSACSAPENTPESSDDAAGDFLIIDISGPLSDPFFGAFKQGSDQAAKDLGIDYEYSASKDYTDIVPTYSQLTEAAIGRNPDALIIGDYFPDTLNPLIEKAVAQGIPVFMTNSGRDAWEDLGALGFIGENPSAMGAYAGEESANLGVTNGLCVNQVPGNPTLEERCVGYTDALEGAGATAKTLVIPAEDASNNQKVQQAIAGALNADPDINGIFTLGATVATDAVEAVKQTPAAGDIVIGTTDISTNALTAVESGELAFIIDQQPFLQGYYSLVGAYQYLQYGLRPANAIDSGPLLITSENVQTVIDVNTEFRGVRGAS
jgi:simple sugar transport system substrate-binding protein